MHLAGLFGLESRRTLSLVLLTWYRYVRGSTYRGLRTEIASAPGRSAEHVMKSRQREPSFPQQSCIAEMFEYLLNDEADWNVVDPSRLAVFRLHD